MSLLDDLIFASDQLVEFYAAFKAKPATAHSVSLLEAFQSELKSLWQDVKFAYARCIRGDEDLKDSLCEVKAKYQSSSSTFFQCSSDIADLLKALNANPKVSNDPGVQSTLPNSEHSHNIKVPACDTQDFHGNYLEWPSLRDMFTAVYINHSKLSDVQKLFHLRSKTKDAAFNIVNKFGLTDNNFHL